MMSRVTFHTAVMQHMGRPASVRELAHEYNIDTKMQLLDKKGPCFSGTANHTSRM